MEKDEKLTIPSNILEYPEEDRDAILKVLKEAVKQPKILELPRSEVNDHKIWSQNIDDLLAKAEDDLYNELIEPWVKTMVDLMTYLGIPYDVKEDKLKKSLGRDFYEWDLEKSNNKGKLSQMIRRSLQQRRKFGKWLQDGKAFTQKQIKRIDEILTERLPDFAKKAEQYVIRAHYIGKIRDKAERENLETLGAYIDRFPNHIEATKDEGVVLTLREKEKAEAEGRKVKILPLTDQEREAVRHAQMSSADKITEVSRRHQTAIRQLVMQAKRERWSAQKLSSELFDRFGDQNRDWRRVAITELAMVTNDAFLANCNEGDRVVGMGAVNACKYCKQLVIGKEFIVRKTPPTHETYTTDMKEVWAGKSNYGRRVAELRPAIPVHPNCRCRWHRLSRFYKVDKGQIVRKTTNELIQEERARRGLPPDPNLK